MSSNAISPLERWADSFRRVLHGHPHYFLIVAIALLALAGIPATTWVTLTVAGLGMGLMIFVMASGMTLSFGLMGVLNLGHGALIAVGAFVGATVVTGSASGHWPMPALAGLAVHLGGAWQWRIGAATLALVAFAIVFVSTRFMHWRILRAIFAVIAAGIVVAALVYVGVLRAFTSDFGLLIPAFLAGAAAGAVVGYVFERVIVRPVYGDHLKQIMVTVGAAIIITQLLKAGWGPSQVPMSRPHLFEGGLSLGHITIERYRLLAGAIGLLVFWGLHRLIQGTRVGLLIRAGVENREMVEAMGYRIRLRFIAVFVGGAALAGLGGVMWGLYQSFVTVQMGQEMLILIIIVIITGGLGSVTGCFYASLLVGLLDNYTLYLFPKVALFTSIALMVGVLMWRPQGLIPVLRH